MCDEMVNEKQLWGLVTTDEYRSSSGVGFGLSMLEIFEALLWLNTDYTSMTVEIELNKAENIVAKGDISPYEQFLISHNVFKSRLLQHCQKEGKS